MLCHLVSKAEPSVSQQSVAKAGGCLLPPPSLSHLTEIQFWHVHSPLQGLSFSSYSWMINQHLGALCYAVPMASWSFPPPASEPGAARGECLCGCYPEALLYSPIPCCQVLSGGFPNPPAV